ncbi:MAG: peptidoglycan DD-metalloendopeptidase family protein [Proteobacteria bacterium]|nr:peptidoglycan DD-metalloendopeptidase family protein [Pseudomonadota bacterium]
MKIIFAILFLLFLPLTVLRAASAEDVDPSASLQQVQQELSSSTAAQAQLVREMAAAIRAQEELSGQLVDLARTAASQEKALTRITAKIDKLKKDNAEALLALAQKRESLSSLLAGLQRLEQNPPPALVVAPGDVLKALRGAMMFGAVIPEVRAETDALRQALAHVEELRDALAAEKGKSEEALAALDKTRADMRGLLDEKRKLSEAHTADLVRERARAKALTEKAKSLKDLVSELEKSKAEEAARMAAEEQARLEAETAAVAEAERQRLAAQERPLLVFSMARGKLDYPAQGKILRNFGDDNGLGGSMEGLLLETPQQSQVLSPVDGKIEFAGTFWSYDQVVIIDPGEGYLVLLAGMAEITAHPGQSIRAGEPIGRMGDRPAAMALAGDLTQLQAPVLYVEFRKKNRSFDPSPWWIAGRKEAMR